MTARNGKSGGGGIISPEEALKFEKSFVIVGSLKNEAAIYQQILGSGYLSERICMPIHEYSGWEYFDYFKPNESEIFVDAGCFNGQTAVEFTKWASKGYDYIYSFEANADLIKTCENTFKKHNLNGEVIGKGVWNKDDILHFESRTVGGSLITGTGKETIETTSLDNVLNGKRVTFIKMDIEGAEYKALLGAEKTIKKWRPRLAICVYHKPEDILEIPALLLEMHSDYQFSLRQYNSSGLGAILYAY